MRSWEGTRNVARLRWVGQCLQGIGLVSDNQGANSLEDSTA